MERLSLIEELSSTRDSSNWIIQGDSTHVLPAVKDRFKGMIKCIYLDPPYNNRDKFKFYKDNVPHDVWCSRMKPIISSLYDLLSEDGSLWISIDDAEMCRLRLMLDEIFGEKNFVSTIIWQHRTTRENRSVFSFNHEYVLVFAKNLAKFKKSRNLLPATDDSLIARYQNPDNDPRGPWQSVTANVQAGHAVASQFYTLVSPNGTEHNPPHGRCWVYNKEKMDEQIRLNNVWFGRTGNNAPRLKKFLKDAKIGLTPHTIWTSDEVGSSDSAKKHLLSIIDDGDVFETPKPEQLLERILTIASNPGDYVLDCFLGSGTTAAVAHKMRRQYIGIECGEQAKTIVVKRLKKVIAGEQGGCSQSCGWDGGGSYSFLTFETTDE